MTYRPSTAVFGPPLWVHIPSLIYVGAALTAGAIVLKGQMSPSDTWIFSYVVEQDVRRVMSVTTLAGILLVGALASVIKSSMRGVRVRGDGVEYRDVVQLFWPRSRFYKWAQIDRITVTPSRRIALDLWDGTQTLLPQVRDSEGLAAKLEVVASARAIPIKGGSGLDEIPEAEELESEA